MSALSGQRVKESSRDAPSEARTVLLLLALTFSTGAADAVGYLALDKVFTGNMTGNVVILGMALVPGSGLPVVGPATALAGFMIGAALGGRCLRGVDAGWTRHTNLLLALVATTFAATAATAAVGAPAPGTLQAFATTASLAIAMGTQAAAARHVQVKDLTTVVVTSTITALAADLTLSAAKSQHVVRRAAAVIALTLGATAGAAALQAGIWAGIALSAAVAAIVVLDRVIGPVARRVDRVLVRRHRRNGDHT